MVHVRGTRSRAPGLDGGARQHVDGLSKSEAGQRSIPIPSWLCSDLAAMLAARGSPLRQDAHLFLNKDGRPLYRDTLRARIVRPALRLWRTACMSAI